MCAARLISMNYLSGLSCALVVAACGTSDSGAMDPELASADPAGYGGHVEFSDLALLY
jgi:hypothetical protein